MGLKLKVKRVGRFTLSNPGEPIRIEQTLRAESHFLDGKCVLVTGGMSGGDACKEFEY